MFDATGSDFSAPQDSPIMGPQSTRLLAHSSEAILAREKTRASLLEELGASESQWKSASARQLEDWALAAAATPRFGHKATPKDYFGRLADWFSARAPGFVSLPKTYHASLDAELLWQQSWWLGRRAQGESWARLWAEAFLANCAGGLRSGAQLIAAAEFVHEKEAAQEALETPGAFEAAFSDLADLFESRKNDWAPPKEDALQNWRNVSNAKGQSLPALITAETRARFERLSALARWAASHERWVDLCLDWKNVPEEDPTRHGDVCGVALRLWNEAGARLPADLRADLSVLARDALARSTKGHEAQWAFAIGDWPAWSKALARESAIELIGGFAPARPPSAAEEQFQANAARQAREMALDEDWDERPEDETEQERLARAEEAAQSARDSLEARRRGRLRAVERSPGTWCKIASRAWTACPEELLAAIGDSAGRPWSGADEILSRQLSLKTLNAAWPAMFLALSQAESAGVNPSPLLSQKAWSGLWLAHIERKAAPSIAGQWALMHWAPDFPEFKRRGQDRIDPQRWAEFEGRILRQEIAGALHGSVAAASQEAGAGSDDEDEAPRETPAPKARSRRL